MKKIILLFLFFSGLSFAQNLDFKFDRITTRDGLNQNTVTTILQNQAGYLWFGTPNGLTRHDGYSFVTFKNLNQLEALTSSKRISVTTEDHYGNMWIGTVNEGLYVLKLQSGKFQLIEKNSDTIGSINSIFTDSDHNVWVGTTKNGLKKYTSDFEVLEHYRFSKKGNSLNSDNITAILEDNNKNLWIANADSGLNLLDLATKNMAKIDLSDSKISITSLNIDPYGVLWIGSTDKGIICFDTNSGQITSFKYDPVNKNSLASNFVHTIVRDSKNSFWIGTDNGLSLINPDEGLFYNFYRDPGDPLSLSGNQILSILEDRSGIMWIGTKRDGLNRVSRSFTDFNNYYKTTHKETSLISDVVREIHEAQFGNIWIGTEEGLTFWDRNRGKYKHFVVKGPSLNKNAVRAIESYGEDKLIIGTNGDGIAIFDINSEQYTFYKQSLHPESISSNIIRDIIKNEDGTFWIATEDGLNLFNPERQIFTRFMHKSNDNASLADNRIMDIEKDNEGNIWAANYSGLSFYSTKTGAFKNYYPDIKNNNNMRFNECNALYLSEREQGIIWVGTENGLNKFEILGEKFSRYLQEDEENNIIYSILEDKEGFLWLGTKRGISRFHRKNDTFKTYNQDDGIRNYEFNPGALLSHSDGSLYMGGLSGMTSFKPSEMKKNDIIPNIAITAFKKFIENVGIDSIQANDGTLELNHQDKFISIEFAAMDFTNSSKNQYRYMLQGFDKTWINSGNRRFASYTNLSGGEYTFHVVGSNNDGVWNEKGATLKIRVKPAYWVTWWFQFLLFTAVFILVYALYKNRTAFMKRQRHELQKEVSVQTRELYKSNLNLQNIMSQNASILENVEEGFFILDKNLEIQSQFSTALLKILEMESPAGLKIISVLEKVLPEKDMGLIRDYLGFIFDHQLDEELIEDLNPFNRLEFHFNVDGKSISKYLTFKFKRIRVQNGISKLIVAVIDETKEIKLSRQLEQNEEKSKARVDLLMGILHLDADMLNEFMSTTYLEISKIENLLQSGHKQDEYKTVLKELINSITMLKENAIDLDLKFFLNDVIEIEAKTTDIQQKEILSGMDFLPVVLQLKEMKSHLDELNNLVERISKFSAQERKQPIILEEHTKN